MDTLAATIVRLVQSLILTPDAPPVLPTDDQLHDYARWLLRTLAANQS
ncbi:hypothetical protein [Nocardia transvalensis]|nr:hypothetical protein [Nocardia transvalensis]MBF6328466.1 hypothetical protein [Nocardia transvalensis]